MGIIMEKDTTYTVNRQELIRIARESCEGNLKSSGNGRFSQGLSMRGATKTKTTIAKAPKVTTTKASRAVTMSAQEKKQTAIKFILIRTICASVIFLAIVVIDKVNFTYETFNSNRIIESVQSNRVYEKAEKFFATLQDEKIVDVFNGLD
ncbi:MAG TPA: hypothetical protein DCE48_13115 [Lachnospiraceae bacterium]|nr:hypothetical protein [Lachnospiraceae bacterium]